jgi:ferredoxin-thioredoxin reductase catalytic subunit
MLKSEERAAAQEKYGVEVTRWIEEVHTITQQSAELYGMEINPNMDIALALCNHLTLTDGYCPSVTPATRNYDTCCPCKDMREKKGCCCGLFVDKV